MKTKIGKIVLSISMAIAAVFTQKAYGGTLHVFAENLGGTSYGSPSTAQQTAYAAFLENNNIDFGAFCGPSAPANFGFSHPDYKADKVDVNVGGVHVLVYNKNRWEKIDYNFSTYKKSDGKDWQSNTGGYILEDKTTHEQFAYIITTGTSFNKGSYLGQVTTIINWCKNTYPNARIVVGTTKAYGLHDSSGLASHIKGQGFDEERYGTDCGAIYAQKHDSRSVFAGTGAAVSWLSGAAEPAAMATVTYRQQFTVSFVDWDGTPLCDTQTVYIGEDATPPADPTRLEYIFTGWNGSYQNIQANVTLTAQYDLENSPGMIMMCW